MVVLASCLAVGACGSGNEFSNSFMALDGAGVRRREAFYTDTETIFCVGEFAGSKTGTTVNAIIRQVQLDSRAVNIVIAVGEDVPKQLGKNVLSFQLVRYVHQASGAATGGNQADEPWPAGKFVCELLVDGQPKAEIPFDILTPNCPLYPAAEGIRCGGFYPPSIKCLSADQSVSCTCSPDTGLWQCAK